MSASTTLAVQAAGLSRTTHTPISVDTLRSVIETDHDGVYNGIIIQIATHPGSWYEFELVGPTTMTDYHNHTIHIRYVLCSFFNQRDAQTATLAGFVGFSFGEQLDLVFFPPLGSASTVLAPDIDQTRRPDRPAPEIQLVIDWNKMRV